MIRDAMKKSVMAAMKANDEVAKSILRVALGEVQMAEVRSGTTPSDEDVAGILRKLIKSNEETMALAEPGPARDALVREVEILKSFLPKGLTTEELVAALAGARDAIVEAKAEGAAIGVAVKHLKAAGMTVGGAEVAAAVKALRGA